MALLAVYLEQVAVDGGRHQLGWLLTGMPNPPFQLAQAHSQRAQEDPVGFLGDPRWVAANFAYFKDVDYFESRKACREQAAGFGPARRASAQTKGKAQGSPEGSGQSRRWRVRRGSVEACEPGACAVATDSRGAFRARLGHEAAVHVPGAHGSAAVAAEPPPFSVDADTPLYRSLLAPTQNGDQRVNEFDAITLALSLRRRILGARCGLAEFCRSSKAQLTAEPGLSLGRDPWPMPPPDPLVDRVARSSRSRSRWWKAAAVREFVRFGVMALSWTLGHPVACPPACRAGVPRTFGQTRQVDRLHVVARALARLGFGPSCDFGRSLDKFRTVGDDLASLNAQVHRFAEAFTGSAHFPASYKFGSGPTPELSQPAHEQSSSVLKVGIRKVDSTRVKWDLGPSFDPLPGRWRALCGLLGSRGPSASQGPVACFASRSSARLSFGVPEAPPEMGRGQCPLSPPC